MTTPHKIQTEHGHKFEKHLQTVCYSKVCSCFCVSIIFNPGTALTFIITIITIIIIATIITIVITSIITSIVTSIITITIIIIIYIYI